MALALLLLFIVVPIVEIALFIQIGGLIGLWPTLLTVVVTAFAGSMMLRTQGIRALHRARSSLNRNELPVQEVFDGFCIVLGGLLLLTPGFLTDATGLLLLFPPVRAMLRTRVWRYVERHSRVEAFAARGAAPGPGGAPPPGPSGWRQDSGRVIEGEYTEVDPERDRRPGE